MKMLIGNTFKIKDEIKKAGGKWIADSKSWMVPPEKYSELHALLNKKRKNAS